MDHSKQLADEQAHADRLFSALQHWHGGKPKGRDHDGCLICKAMRAHEQRRAETSAELPIAVADDAIADQCVAS